MKNGGQTMIVVTGGAGFIGSNIIKGLNNLGHTDILVVDDLHNGTKFSNLVDCKILDYLDKNDFLDKIATDQPFPTKISAVFHQGACTDTMEWDGSYMMRNNYQYSKTLFQYCLGTYIPFIYASSAAVYGKNKIFRESNNEKPLNIYGYSKFLFDQYVRRFLPNPKSQVIGLRYFNVYGPHEQHKGKLASVIDHFNDEMLREQRVHLFGASDGYTAGEQRRDFIHIDDVVAVNLWFWQHQDKSGIFNVGTGKSETFNKVARQITAWHGGSAKNIVYIPFPQKLQNAYQSFTEADITELRKAGYDKQFIGIEEGVKLYLTYLNSNHS
jgi:ADP-L-glycero-D-manno-heptose 6-epimerase